jgi:hypothetical protein
MARLSKILFAILIAFSFVPGSLATATTRNSYRHRHRRHDRGLKHTGKRVGEGAGDAGKGVGRAGRKTGRKIKHIVTE